MKKEAVTELIGAEKIAARVKELAAEITRDYEGNEVVFIGVLRGAVVFFSDLIREVKLDAQLDFVKVSSYGDSSKSDGKIQLDYPPDTDLTGRHVILVEDIVDMGYTAKWLREHFEIYSPASLKICALLDKPERRKVPDVTIDYLGFTIPDEFVVGYGLDYSQRHRNLPFIGKIEL
ncbi:MAG: hypoxanthine phosphoribosyltransferase [Defluviitaleaceae bacterium]|nr:hypoxanthine phosphoribosyltransferase [Defluviitaleaceae bacterium]MCL2264184.1 hypoxanthine phosphoribosyltransferase [Defluviitaleaceae bacterium]